MVKKTSVARRADEILLGKSGYFKLSDKEKKNSRPTKGYFKLFPTEKKNIMVAFAKRNKPVHSQAYDLIRTKSKIDFSDIHDIERKIEDITFIEVKGTVEDLDAKFTNHFFGVTVEEMRMAQEHIEQYRFVFVNVKHNYKLEMNLHGFFSRIRKLYPTFSVRFN